MDHQILPEVKCNRWPAWPRRRAVVAAAALVIVLACGSPQKKAAVSSALPADRPAIVIENLKTHVHRGGVKLQEIQASWALMDQIENTLDMRDLKVEFYDNGSFKGRANSGAGWMWLKDKPSEKPGEAVGAHDMMLTKNVLLSTSEGLLLRTPEMHYTSADRVLKSDKGFVKQMPANSGKFIIGHGDAFEIKLAEDRSTFENYTEHGHPVTWTKSDQEVIKP